MEPGFQAVAVYMTSLLMKLWDAITLKQGRGIAIFARLGTFVAVVYLIWSIESLSASPNVRSKIGPLRQTVRVKSHVFILPAGDTRDGQQPLNVQAGGKSLAAELLGCVYEIPMTVLPNWLRHRLFRHVPAVPPFELLRPS